LSYYPFYRLIEEDTSRENILQIGSTGRSGENSIEKNGMVTFDPWK
jgi:hypothetical protein